MREGDLRDLGYIREIGSATLLEMSLTDRGLEGGYRIDSWRYVLPPELKDYAKVEETADARRAMNPWVPISDPLLLAILGKLQEELNELGAAVARATIQGLDECEPVSEKPNAQWISEEISDVEAGLRHLTERTGIDVIPSRVERKYDQLAEWLTLIHPEIEKRKEAAK